MTLKTLKDLEKQDWSTHKEDMGLIRAVFFDSRQAAIKAVKQWLSKTDLEWSIENGKFTFKKMPLDPSILVNFGSIGAFVWFFNIEESELR